VYSQLFNLNQIVDLKESIDYFASISCKKSVFEECDESRQNYDSISTESFTQAYIQIVTESHFGHEDVHITEKSFKPFYFYQIPIFLASHGHVARLRERYPNLDFFDDVVDHRRYDDIKDDVERLNVVYDEIKKLHRNRDEIRHFYASNEDRFIRNRKMILNDVVKDKSDYNFFTDLINKKRTVYFFNSFYDERLDGNETIVDKKTTDAILVFYGIYHSKIYHIDDVDTIDDRNVYYIYRHGKPLSNLINLYGGLNLSDKLVNLLKKKKNLKVILLNEYESDFADVLKSLGAELKRLELSPEQFYVVNNNFNLLKYREDLKSKINVHVINRLPTINSQTMSIYDHPFNTNKEFFFMSHCRVVKAHRYGIFMLLKKHGMLSDTDWSVLKGADYIKSKIKNSLNGVNYEFFS
jgi:hypothetical protein